MAERFGKSVGRLLFRLSRKYRSRALSNLAMCFPEWSSQKVHATAVGVFEHFGRLMVQFFRFDRVSDQQILDSVEFEGLEAIEAALDKGKGALVVTAHFGDWERMAHSVAIRGKKISVVARDSNEERTTKLVNSVRKRHGIDVFSRGRAAREILRRLAANEIVGILTDQNTREILVPFFGIPAGTNEAPAALHLRLGTPLFTAFCAEIAPGRYRAVVEPVTFTPRKESRERDVVEIMSLINERIERAVRERPEQWLWMHDRWRWTRELGLLEKAKTP
jgi:KDO2-lipid IV(A) lauroyltransferase